MMPDSSGMVGSVRRCPFCGDAGVTEATTRLYELPCDRIGYRVMCIGCGVSTRWFSSIDSAHAAWNLREE